eukprot:jgi/Mesvir1/28475/Mv15896-RA.1
MGKIISGCEDAVTVFIVVIAVEYLSRLARWFLQNISERKPSRKERELARELAKLRREAAACNSPDFFVQHTKLQRAATAKEKELEEVRSAAAREWSASGWRLVLPLLRLCARTCIKGAAYSWLTSTLWGVPVASLPIWTTAQPLGTILAFPHGAAWHGGGAVAILPWLMMVSSVGAMLVG